jgi:hypothetical protein
MNAIAEIFRARGADPVEAADVRLLIAGLEQQIGNAIPRTFQQFLSLENGVELLGHFSNCDNPIPFGELGRIQEAWSGYNPFHHNLLPFMYESQGVCTWAVALDEGDDPPVLVEIDSGVPPSWRTVADTFSLWLECQVSDWPLYPTWKFAAQAPELEETGLALLRQRFKEGHTTFAWPGTRNYRFSSARLKLLLWDAEGQCDWWISPQPGASVGEALEELRRISRPREGYLCAASRG